MTPKVSQTVTARIDARAKAKAEAAAELRAARAPVPRVPRRRKGPLNGGSR